MATNLADILVTLTVDTNNFKRQLDRAGQQLNDFRNRVRQTTSDLNGDFTRNMTDIGTVLQTTNRLLERTANDTVRNNQRSADSFNRVGASSRTLARRLGTDLGDMTRVSVAATREFRDFGAAGRQVSQQVREEFRHLPRHLQQYVERLQAAGQSTERFARLNQRFGQRWMEQMRRNNDYMQNRTAQSTRLIEALARQDMMPLSRQFLRVGQSMENAARRGSVLNLAISRLGENAGPAELRNEMQLISQGLGRMRGAFIGFGVVSLVALGGLGYIAAHVDERVVPAFERFKETWLDAFMPWITAIASTMVALLDLGSGINNLIGEFSSANPLLFKMIGGILLLTAVFGTLLAPLAIGIGLTGGLSASFAVLWAMISPFVLGMLTVAGVSLLVAAAVVVLWVSIKSLWKNSEAFRDAFIGLWDGIKAAVIDGFVNPVKSAWGDLKTAFSDLIATFTGGEGTMSNLWTFLGDHIAIVVEGISSVVLPILQGAFKVLGAIVVGIINSIIAVLTWLAEMWSVHGETITAVVAMIWGHVQTAFGAVRDFISSIMPSIMTTITSGFNLIKQIIDFVMKYIAPVVVAAFTVIWEIIKFVMPWILNIIKSVWNNIKNVITSAIGIIQGVIKLFSSILQGDWKEAWNAVKSIVKNGLILIWNLIQLYAIGKMLKLFSGFWVAVKSFFTTGWTKLANITKSAGTTIKKAVTQAFEAVKNAISLKLRTAANLAKQSFNTLKNGATTAFNKLKTSATNIFNKVKEAITKPIETAKKTVMKIIDKIKGAFAGMAITIPKPKIPKVSVSMKENSWGIPYPSFNVNWNAKGGIYNGASILGGGQGVGEAGAEAVLPIQHKRYMRPFAQAVGTYLSDNSPTNNQPADSGNKYEINFNQPVVIREDADITRIVDELEKRKRTEQRSKGVFAFSN